MDEGNAMDAPAKRQAQRAAISAAAALIVVGCTLAGGDKVGGAAHGVRVLTLINAESDDSTVLPFAQAVKTLSSGSLVVQIKNQWRNDDVEADGDLIRDVEAGSADLGVDPTRSFDTVGVNSFQALQAPFLIDTYPLEANVLGSSVSAEMLKGLEPPGLVGLAVVPGPMRRLLGLSRALVTVADIRGATIGIRPSGVTETTLEVLGAHPVAFIPGGPIALSSLDGVESHIDAIAGNRYDTGAVALTTNLDLWPRPSVIFANAAVFRGLTDEQQGWLRAAGVTAAANGMPEVRDLENRVSELCLRHLRFVTATGGELAELRHAVEPVYAELRSDVTTKGLLDQIQAIRARTEGSPDIPPSCAPSETSPGPSPPRPKTSPSAPSAPSESGPSASRLATQPAATPVDGMWEVTFTEADLLAAQPPPVSGEDIPENYGHFRMDLHAGTYVVTGPLDRSDGVFAVEGNRITLSNPSNGDTFTVTWSIYRDTLSFGVGLPTGMRVKPWHRVEP
jgi:TRAP-type C4-dicarboxylate transport system substrate-binding protein